MLSAFKNFLVTFLVAALVFGTVAYFATSFLTDTITGIFDSESSELDSILNPGADSSAHTVTQPPDSSSDPKSEVPEILGSSFNMLFIVTDYQPDIFHDYLPDDAALSAMEEDSSITTGILATPYRRPRATAILLFRADKERKEFTYTVFPTDMRVSTSSGNQSMGDLYNLYGRDYILSEVSALTGLEIQYYLMINITELSTAVTQLGGFPMYLQKDLYFDGKTATNIPPSEEDADFMQLLYSAGKNTIDGPGVVALLMNQDVTADATERSTLITTIFSGIMNKLTSMPEAEFIAFYENICSEGLVDTTFTSQTLSSELDLIYALTNDAFQKTIVSYPGRYIAATDTEDAYFEPNRTAGLNLFKNYRNLLQIDGKN